MLVTFVIGANDGQCHKNPIVTVIVGTKRFRKVVHCIESAGLPRWKNFWLLHPISNHPKRQPNSFNCWILFGRCGNLFDHPHNFMTPAYGSLCSLQFVTVFRCTRKLSGMCW